MRLSIRPQPLATQRGPAPIAAASPALSFTFSFALSLALSLTVGVLAIGCSGTGGNGGESQSDADRAAAALTTPPVPNAVPGSAERLVQYTEERAPCAHYTETRLPLFGDLHVHSNLSFDAAANTIGATPADAYRYGKGEPISFWPLENGKPAGQFKIDRPLDFLAVTDHGEFLGERRLCRDPDSPTYDAAFCKGTRVSERQGMMLFGQVITTETPERIPDVCGDDGARCLEYARGPWQQIGDAAEEAYDRSSRCSFTSFKAYEYTGTPGTSNYHRNVIFRNRSVPDLPVSYVDAPYDSALWAGLDATCTAEAGCSYITIPHNTNLANGRMAPYMRLDPTLSNRRAYAAKRLEREPIMEIFQHKGASECINGLSSVLGEPDELCNVEAVRVMGRKEEFIELQASEANAAGEIQIDATPASRVTVECGDEVGDSGMLGAGCVDATDYQRSALLVGMEEKQETGLNPVKLGVIGSTDTHAATPGAALEDDWRGHVTLEATPAERLQPGLLTSGIDGNPGGLAGVWAVENSRDAIFEAMQRREVFGTSGPRIAPRFFAGWDFAPDACRSGDLAAAGYAGGVPMGGDLPGAPSRDAKPVFLASAMRDAAPNSAPLQQLQLIKGWIDADGQRRTQVIPIAGGPNDARVDLSTGERIGDGHDSLCSVYRDEDFDPDQPTYYYVRVVENPSARWHVYDCKRLPAADRPAVCTDGSYPSTIQEMAWTSPIWYQP